MAGDHPQYKDRLFNFIFGSEENRAWTLSLYNAINGSNYTDPEAIRITTIKGVLYLGMRNDVSFLISGEMNLYEQQSSFNPNMPLRLLQYAGNLYEKYVVENKLNKYGSTLLKLPVPRLVVFYNGEREQSDEIILKLSDSFPEGVEADIEVRVRMLNVNYGRNRKLLEECKPLGEYAWLVEEVRKNKGQKGIESAIDRAITDMPEDFIIRPFLASHRSEVRGMLLTEYDEAEAMERFREDGWREGHREGHREGLHEGRREGHREGLHEGRREGLREGRAEGYFQALAGLVKDGLLSLKDAAHKAEMTEDSFSSQMATLAAS